MARRPQMDISFDLQPSLEYIQWYSSTRKPYLLGWQSDVAPLHMHRLRAYETELELEPKRSHTHPRDSSYNPELRVSNYFLGSSGHGYHSKFDILNPIPPQNNTPHGPYTPHYSTLFRSYPLQYSTPPGSSSLMASRAYEISFMFHTPPLRLKRMLIATTTHNVNVDPCRNIPLGPHY
ncbi:hypothetical protein PVK06_034660 [Gossypium arboreum]|uniref:Uncharacterized protein n=1 Tax=Gossypium arboreum TaxID=29729 RepID=A0ABR0NER6_GOSAR|nr:hypothetical protein PVK06_034660 [Gossypium arboreum]